MATTSVNFSAPSAAPTASNAAGSAAGSTASNGVAGDTSGGSGGLSFNDLMNSAGSGASGSGAADTSADDALAADDGGENVPPGGNDLPLPLPLLALLPLESQAPAVEGESAGTAPVSTSSQSAANLPLPTTQAAAVVPADGEPLPDDVLQSLNVANTGGAPQTDGKTAQIPGDVLAQSEAAEDASAQIARDFASTHQARAEKAPVAQTVLAQQTDQSAAAAIAAQLTQGDEGGDVDQDALDRLLASAQAATAQSKTSASSTGSQVSTPSTTAAPIVPTQISASATNTPSAEVIGVSEAQQLLKDFKFVGDGVTSTHASAPHAAGLQPSATTAAADDVPVTTQLPTPMQNQQQWADGLGERLVWMTSNNHQNAQIRLNPAHLGPIEVQISMADDKTNISFVAHNATTRDALEASAPRLREVLSSHGMGTVNVNINHQSSSERSAHGSPQDLWHSYGNGSSGDAAAFDSGLPAATTRQRSLIDAYA